MRQEKVENPKVLNETSNLSKTQSVPNISPTRDKKCSRKYVCTYAGCSATFTKQSRFNGHIRVHTGERPYKCNHPGCDKAYTNSSHLKRHTRTHSTVQKRFQCHKCLLTISNYHNLRRHYTRVHNNNTLTCNECDAVFHKKYQLIKHMATHFGPTSYKCSRCNKTYINLKRLKRHEVTHEKGQKSYPCEFAECSEVFYKWALLCKHKKTQHVNDHRCTQCGKQFSSKTNLRSHSKIHAENRPSIPCPYDECKRTYTSKSNLRNHIKTYHLDLKYFCDICKAGLSSKRKLILHIMLIHEDSKITMIPKESKRRKRKDAGLPRKSMVTVLTGLKFVHNKDKELLQRETDIQSNVQTQVDQNKEGSCVI